MAPTRPSLEQLEHQHQLEFSAIRNVGVPVDIAYIGERDEEGFIAACKGYSIVLCAGNPPLNRRVVEQTKDVKVYVRYGIGINSIDMDACADNGRLVYFMPGYCKEELAIHALALMLSLLRSTVLYDRKMRAGGYPKAQGPLPHRLSNLTVGLYGLGGSAVELCRILREGFHSKVISCDPFVSAEKAENLGVELVSFDQLLERSDIISCHVPLTKDTHHIFNHDAFKKMKSTSMLINVARGPLVDLDDLYDALVQGEIGFAGLDVFEIEPTNAELPLFKLENVVVTPHSAFHGAESTHEQYRLAAMFVSDLIRDKVIHPAYVGNRSLLPQLEKAGFTLAAR